MILFLAQNQKKRHQHRRGMSSETSASLNSAYYTTPKKESQSSICKKHSFLWGGFSQMRR